MLRKIIYLGFLAGAALCFTACEKVIDVDIKESASQLVIEGTITDQPGEQVVKITRSVPYTNTNTYPPVSGATVTVTDNGSNVWQFTEREPGVYTRPFKGIPGTTYSLTVDLDGQTYTAQSLMPQHVPLDSVGITLITLGSEERKLVSVYFVDPPQVKNQYRYVMKVNDRLTKRVYAGNDRLTNGNNIKEQLFYQDDEDNEEITSGDRVEVEMQCIDEAVFKYWYSLAEQTRGGPGGGVTPGNPPSNISGNVLGYFSAHTTETKSITVE